MKLNAIMEIIHGSYPDGMTRNYWDPVQRQPAPGSGDTLAEFIVREIAETYDTEASDLSDLMMVYSASRLRRALSKPG